MEGFVILIKAYLHQKVCQLKPDMESFVPIFPDEFFLGHFFWAKSDQLQGVLKLGESPKV